MAENDPIAENNPVADTAASASEAQQPAPAPTPARPGPKPHPGPRPGGPRPGGPRPGGPRPQAAAPSAPRTRPASDPSKHGRVDPDGTVYVITSAGERAVGSWQAGEVTEGLAHFGRKYDELSTEIEVLEERLAGGTGDPKKVRAAAQQIADSLPTAAVVGDLDALASRVGALLTGADTAIVTSQADRDKHRSESIARKEELAAEAEKIAAEATQWKSAGDRMRALLDEWKTIKGVDRKTDDALWKRYSKARDAFNKRRGAHFAELDRERAGARARKEELIAEAEKLKDDTNWGETSAKFRDLLAKWKAAGRAPRDADDALWARFKGVQDEFFAARNAAAHERDAEFAENGKAKQALLDEYAPRIESAANLNASKAALRELQDKWEAIGKVPREQMGSLEAGIRNLEKQVKSADDTAWRRTDPEATARAAQFRDRVAQFEEQAQKAEKAGKTKEAVRLREQAQQWREWADAAESAVESR